MVAPESNITDMIKNAIKDTAKRMNNENITTAEDMIPHMRTRLSNKKYPLKYVEDIQYADSEDAKMDIYYPDEGEGPFPVFIEVHGGAWFFGQKSSIEFAPFLKGLKRGYACVSLGYTLSPKAVYPQPVIEIKKAIGYIKENAGKLNIDPDRIALWGGSAGAHLAALAAFSNDTGYLKNQSGNVDSSVKVLVLWYGCHNFYLGKKLDMWIYENFFGEKDLDKVREKIILSNPGCHVTENAPYTLLQHGISDTVVPYGQSVYLYNVIKDIAGEERCSLDLCEKCDHADIRLFAESNISRVFDYIDSRINIK